MIHERAPSGAVTSVIRVLLVEDQRSVLWGLHKLVDGEAPRMTVAGEATCWKEALTGLAHNPDVILLDLDLADENAFDMVAQLRYRSPAKIIVLTGRRDPQSCGQAVIQGASGLVHKSEPPEIILRAISHVHGGGLWLESHMAARALSSLSAKENRTAHPGELPSEKLTDRQRHIVKAVVKHKGAPAKVIADAMQISSNTLRNHLAVIYGKLGIHRRIDLILYAMQVGLDKQEVGMRATSDTRTARPSLVTRS